MKQEEWDSYDWRQRVEVANKKSPVCSPDWEDLEFLYDTVKKDKPYSILEYGCGMSTIVMAKALEELGGNRGLLALENDPFFFTSFGNFFYSYHNTKFWVVFSAISNHPPTFLRYIYCPVDTADLVYIDGPMLLDNYRIVTNFMDLRPYPKKFIVDGRTDQVVYMQTMLGSMYEIDINKDSYRTTFTKEDKNG